MRFVLRVALVLVATCAAASALADNPCPFFQGETAQVSAGPEGFVLENDIYRRVISTEMRTVSLQYQGTELLASSTGEGEIVLGNGELVEAAGSTVLGYDVSEARDSLVLRIHLQREGLLFTVCYRVFRGNRPWLAKWFEFAEPTEVYKVQLDDLRFRPEFDRQFLGEWGDNGIVAGGSGYAFGIQVNEGMPLASCTRYSLGIRSSLKVQAQVTETEPSVLAICRGSRFTAAFALQLYWGAYLSHASMFNRPIVFNTWYGYKWWLTEADCLRAIDRVADLGCDIFVVDDGWQKKYGDWVATRDRFPRGLEALGAECRSKGIEFGFWMAPALTAQDAESYQRSNVVLHPNQTPYAPGNGTYHVNCFASPWKEHITARILDEIRASGATFMKLDFILFVEGCYAPNHGHTPGEATAAQTAAWKDFLAAVRAEVPNFHVYRTGTRAERTSYNDFGWYSDWLLASLYDPRRYESRWWYRSADSTRYAAYSSGLLTPNWCRTGTSPLSIPFCADSLDALEYNLTSVCALFCNFELSNMVEYMTAEEESLVRKWMAWFRANTDYLAYAQFDNATARPYDPWNEGLYGLEWVDGVYHLRPKLRGRYGYLCFWNPSESAKVVTVNILPSDYFLPGDIATAWFHAMQGGWEAPNGSDRIQCQFEMPPLSWEIISLFDPNDPEYRDFVTLRGRVDFGYRSELAPPVPSVTLRITSTAGEEYHEARLSETGEFEVFVELSRGECVVSVKPSHYLRNAVRLYNDGRGNAEAVFMLVNGDANGDNAVDVQDLSSVLLNFGRSHAMADLDEDGLVGLPDLAIVLVSFAKIGDP